MRLIRQLPVADAAVPSKFRRERSWSIGRGLLFAIGLALLGGRPRDGRLLPVGASQFGHGRDDLG